VCYIHMDSAYIYILNYFFTGSIKVALVYSKELKVVPHCITNNSEGHTDEVGNNTHTYWYYFISTKFWFQ
jgi:hypothetical protein